MTASPVGITRPIRGFAQPIAQPANDLRAAPPRRMLSPPVRQEIAAMAAAYLRDLGVSEPDRLMRLGVRLIERVENRAPTAREDVMLTAFDEMQRLIGDEAGAAASPVRAESAELAGRLGLWLASCQAAAQEPVPLGSPVAPELPDMVPQLLETWIERVQAMGRRLVRAVLGGGVEGEAPATIRVDA
jgi:hypothetical protein